MTILYCLRCDDEVRDFELDPHLEHVCIVRREVFRPLNRRNRRESASFFKGGLSLAIGFLAVGYAAWVIWSSVR